MKFEDLTPARAQSASYAPGSNAAPIGLVEVSVER